MKIYVNKYIDEIVQNHVINKEEKISNAKHKLARAYLETEYHGLGIFTITDMPFPNDMRAFLHELNAAGITEMNLCDKSTDLMSSLHFLLLDGWAVKEPFAHLNPHHGLQGLRMTKTS
jgi:hypothetical protein